MSPTAAEDDDGFDFCCRGSADDISPCSPFYREQESSKQPAFRIFATLHDDRERLAVQTTAEQAIDLGKRRGKPVQNLRLF